MPAPKKISKMQSEVHKASEKIVQEEIKETRVVNLSDSGDNCSCGSSHKFDDEKS